MSVTVQIPDTGAFLETTVADFSNVSGLIQVGNFLHMCGGLATGKYLKIAKDFSSHTTLTFPGDGKHEVAFDLVYAPAPIDRIYVLFLNDSGTQMTIGTVNPNTPAIEADFLNQDSGGDVHGIIGIATDNLNLYVVSQTDTPSQLLKYPLPSGVGSSVPITGFTLASGIRYANGKLFVHGTQVGTAWITRHLASTLALEQSTTTPGVGGAGHTHEFSVAGSYLWLGSNETNGIIRRYSQSDLSLTQILTQQASKSVEVDFDGTNVWSLFENGRAARINPNNSAVSLYTVNQGQGYQREITRDGNYIFTAT